VSTEWTNPPGLRDAQDSASAAVASALRTAGLVWGGAWLANIAVAFLGYPPISKIPLMTGCFIFISLGLWILHLSHRLPNSVYAIGLCASAFAQFILVNAVQIPHNYLYLTATINSAVILGSFVLSLRVARGLTFGMSVLVGLWLVFSAAQALALAETWRYITIISYYALADGMAVSLALFVLRRAASQSDDERQQAAQQLAYTRRREAIREEAERVDGLLHDTLVNTFGAIRRGVEHSRVTLLRERCQSDLFRITDIERSSDNPSRVDLNSLATSAVATARTLGVSCNVTCLQDTVSGSIGVVALSAVRELLVNASKHAHGSSVDISFTLDAQSPQNYVIVCVRDYGPGWDGQGQLRGFGRFVRDRVIAIGGSYSVESLFDGGTKVTLSLPTDDVQVASENPESNLAQPVSAALSKVVWFSGGWMASLGLVQTAVAWHRPSFGPSLVALLILVLAVALASRISAQGRSLPTRVQWCMAAMLAGVVALPQLQLAGCSITAAGAWGPDGGIAVVLAMVLFGRGLLPTILSCCGMAVGLAWPLITGATSFADCIGPMATTLVIEVGSVSVVHLLRSRSELLLTQSQAAWSVAVHARANEAALEGRRDILHSRLHKAVAHSQGLMQDIAQGSRDPLSPSVQLEAAAHERTLRSLLAVPPDLGRLGEILADATLSAADSGRWVRVNNAEPLSLPTPSQTDGIEAIIRRVIGEIPEQQAMTVTLLESEGMRELSLVAQVDLSLLSSEISEIGLRHDLRVTSRTFEDEHQISMEWK
jgi:signal transduction histidine kinase